MSDWDDWGDWDDEEEEGGLFDSLREMWGNFAKREPILFPPGSIVSDPKTENIMSRKFFLYLEPETCAVFNAVNGDQFQINKGGMVTLPEGFKPGKYTKRYVYCGAQLTRMDILRAKTIDDRMISLKIGVVWSTNNPIGATTQNPVKLLKYYVEGEVITYIGSKRHDQIVNMAQIDFDVEGHTEKFVTDEALTVEQISQDIKQELFKIEAFRNSFNLKVIRIFDRIPDPKRAKFIRERSQELIDGAADLLLDLSDIEREKKVTQRERTLLAETGKLDQELQQLNQILQLAEVTGQLEREKILQSIEMMKIIVDRERNIQGYDQEKIMALVNQFENTLLGYAEIAKRPGVSAEDSREIMGAISDAIETLKEASPTRGINNLFNRRELPKETPRRRFPPRDKPDDDEDDNGD